MPETFEEWRGNHPVQRIWESDLRAAWNAAVASQQAEIERLKHDLDFYGPQKPEEIAKLRAVVEAARVVLRNANEVGALPVSFNHLHDALAALDEREKV